MAGRSRLTAGVVRVWAVLGVVFVGLGVCSPQVKEPKGGVAASAATQTEQDFSTTQERLLLLLRASPTLTSVVVRDPSLLANQDYVKKYNPDLEQFIEVHPEIARNPDYYLFTKLNLRGRREQALEQKIWPEFSQGQETSSAPLFIRGLSSLLVFVAGVSALLWLIRLLIENRRWGRTFRLQTEVHSKLIDRFASNQELLNYMGTESGKRFLEAAPIPVEFEQGQRIPNVLGKVLLPLQVGVVMVLLGIGLLFLRHSLVDQSVPLLILGVVVLMPGIGFILSAGITWVLASRLGLMPGGDAASGRGQAPHGLDGQ